MQGSVTLCKLVVAPDYTIVFFCYFPPTYDNGEIKQEPATFCCDIVNQI